MIVFTDRCLDQIGQGIAAHEPEVGGALLKLPDSNVVCEFVADPAAQTSRASYVPSAELTSKVRGAEREHKLHFAGVIHSHPGSMSQPSGQDHRAFALSLAVNPRLAAFIAPIVTIPQPFGNLQPNQHLLNPRGMMTLHVAYRTQRGLETTRRSSRLPYPTHTRRLRWGRLSDDLEEDARAWSGERRYTRSERSWLKDDPRNDGVDLYDLPIGVLSIDADIALLRDRLHDLCGLEWRGGCEVTYADVNGCPFISAALKFEELELVLLLSTGYPFTAPIALLTPLRGDEPGDTAQVQFHWPIGGQETRLMQLAAAVADQLKIAKPKARLRGAWPGDRSAEAGEAPRLSPNSFDNGASQ